MAATPGIRTRHSRSCKSLDGGRCNCAPSVEAWVWSKRDEKKIRKTFTGPGAVAAAKGWRADASTQVRKRTLRAPSPRTLRQEVDEWLAGARSGEIRNRREQQYKPAVIRGYELALRLRVLPELGDRKLADVDFADLLELKEHLQGAGVSDSTVRNTFVPLQAIYRRARRLGRVSINPTLDLGLPSAGHRDRAATPQQAAEQLAALTDSPQALWATAFYAGLRRGELRALRVRNVHLDTQRIDVEHSWDDREGEIAPKSRAGTRTVFVADELRGYLEVLVDGRPDDAFVFGSDLSPFEPRAVDRRAARMLDAVDKKRTDDAAKRDDQPTLLGRFILHEARHSFSTWLDHAGVSADRANRYMGHSSGSVPSRYRHLLDEQIASDREALDAYLAGAAAGKVVAIRDDRVAV